MTSTGTGRPGVSTKRNALSCGSGSDPARTVPLTFGSASVNCVNVTEAEALGATLTGRLSIVRPSSSSVTGRLLMAAAPRFVTPAVMVSRSWPENDARAKVTDGTATFEKSAEATDFGVSTVPGGKCSSSPPAAPAQPVF